MIAPPCSAPLHTLLTRRRDDARGFTAHCIFCYNKNITCRTIGNASMAYYFSKTLKTSFDDAVTRVTQGLQREEFGILTIIDIKDTIKKKLNVDFKKYMILGACHPSSAYQAFQAEDNIGLLLPCNVIVREIADGVVEIAAVDPGATMAIVRNPKLDAIAGKVRTKLKAVIDNL
jgi:uncharacterized protein (DUF302 family)